MGKFTGPVQYLEVIVLVLEEGVRRGDRRLYPAGVRDLIFARRHLNSLMAKTVISIDHTTFPIATTVWSGFSRGAARRA